MKLIKTDYIYFVFIFIISSILVFDLFLTSGRPATFDGVVHITQIAQFTTALRDGDFPVAWLDGFANYGLPFGIFAHQLTNYTGALMTFLTNNPTQSFNIIIFIGVLLSNIFYYLFLRIYFKPHIAFLATVIFNFTPYRIINLYIRGAGPELFSNLFPPLIFIVTYYFVKNRNIFWFLLLCVLFFLLILNHPMLFVIYCFLFFPYLIFLVFFNKGKFSISDTIKLKLKIIGLFILALIIGLGMASYYLLPVLIEIKYFYYGPGSHFSQGTYISFWNYFNPNWYYFTDTEIFIRGHVITTGIIETTSIILGFGYIVWKYIIRKKKVNVSLLEFSVLTSLVILFFTTKYSDIFYNYISVLGNIQFSWRMLSAFIFLPPIIVAFMLRKASPYLMLPLVLIILINSFPQIYGKNYAIFPEQSYYFTPFNHHSINMNTIWSGKSDDYPVQRNKIDIIAGEGKILSKIIKNSLREYTINAKTSLNVVDYTFYFPGWNVYIDGQKSNIEYQDPAYRGIITYKVPEGKHNILIKFEDTKVRLFGKMLSLFFMFIFIVIIIFRKKIFKYV